MIRRWMRSVLHEIIHYKAEHRRYVNEAAATLQSSLPNDILFRNALPFLELPSVHMMGRKRWAVKTVLVSRENKRYEAKETGMHGCIWCFDRYGTSDGDMFLLDSSDLDELTTQNTFAQLLVLVDCIHYSVRQEPTRMFLNSDSAHCYRN